MQELNSTMEKALKNPILVEQESESKYVLVKGYRRYFALQFIGKKEALCMVDQKTSEDRMINRLLEIKKYEIALVK